MIFIEDNAVFVVVAVGGILEVPLFAVKRYGDKAYILPCGVGMVAVEAFIFAAQ